MCLYNYGAKQTITKGLETRCTVTTKRIANLGTKFVLMPVFKVEATSPSLEQGSFPQLERYPFKELKAEETRKKGKMISKKEKKEG